MHDGRLGMLILFLQVFVSTASAEVATRVVRFTHGDVVVEGLIAWDDQATCQRPGVLVIHGDWGYSDHAREQEVTARFSEPGEYILRAMAHDGAFDTTRGITVRVEPR